MTAILEPAEATTSAGLDRHIVLAEPGVYDAIPEDVYHSDPVPGGSLSSSGIRKLLPPSCPARFFHDLKHPTPPNRTLDFGSAAHRDVLGYGPELVVVDAKDWRTNAAKEAAAKARARGAIPLLPHEREQITAMATAIRNHDEAGALINPDNGGMPEQTMIWQDPTGVMCRARVDWMPEPSPYRRTIFVDYKTARSANPDAIAKAIYEHGYHIQAAWYLAGARALGWAERDAVFVFIFQEKEPPYLITPVQLHAEALMWGEQLAAKAIDTYLTCMETGYWPDYVDAYGEDVPTVNLPTYALRSYEFSEQRGFFTTTH